MAKIEKKILQEFYVIYTAELCVEMPVKLK